MKSLLPNIISREQDEFVKRMQIANGIILMHELLHCVKVKKEEVMLIKMDMEKAYDRVKCSFLDKIFDRFGFELKWREWIMECISTPKVSIIVNGEVEDYFIMERDL